MVVELDQWKFIALFGGDRKSCQLWLSIIVGVEFGVSNSDEKM